MHGPVQPVATSTGRVRALSDWRCIPSEPKFEGSSQVSIALRIAGHSLSIAAYQALPSDCAITVYSDSQLCVNTINEWARGWEARGWRRKTGPIANLELVKELWALAKAHPRVQLRWIKAHDGSRWNEYADALSTYWMLDRA